MMRWAAGWWLVASATLAQDFSKVTVVSHPVSGPIHVIEGAGGNVAVSGGPDGLLLVDSQFGEVSDKIKAELSKITKGTVKFLINTHWHQDHRSGNEAFADSAVVMAHENVRARMAQGGFSKFFNRQVNKAPEAALPTLTYTDAVALHFNGEKIDVIALPPGHTDTDSVVIFRGSKVIHMGDHYFADGFPFVDLESGGNVDGFIRNIGVVIDEVSSDYKVIPGHGAKPRTIKDLTAYYEMLRASVAQIRAKKAKSVPLDQAKKEGLPDFEKWGKGFISTDRWIEIVYNSK
jgi:glyoxylase-like metal-dependent hydrolase (beta-lactamase superfamily II)